MNSLGGGKTVGEILKALVSRIAKISTTPFLDAQLLLAQFLHETRSWVLAHPEALLTLNQLAGLETLVTRLEGGEPLPYIFGFWEFFGLEFDITPDVLIPRPETELLVERAISWLKKLPPRQFELRVIDIGTGSGCIAISIAVNLPGAIVTATDISPSALKVATRNADKYNVAGRVSFIEADLFPDSEFIDPYTLILANLPYIPTKTLQRLPIFGREPTLALDGGPDGLALFRRLLSEVPGKLIPGGLALIEFEASEGPAVLSLAYEAFPTARILLHKDLAGHDRLLEIET